MFLWERLTLYRNTSNKQHSNPRFKNIPDPIYLPSGKSISVVGVSPDITVEEESEDFRILSENDNQLKFARKLFTG